MKNKDKRPREENICPFCDWKGVVYNASTGKRERCGECGGSGMADRKRGGK